MYDVVIIGGGPGGLSAALALGRTRRRVLLCDAGPRRNQLAVHIHNFVTRDGTPPDEFRRIAREQLAAYPSVTIADTRVAAISGTRGAFQVRLSANGADIDRTVEARRILLATGMVDDMLPIDGFREAWGHSIFQCPYCHGWEVRDRPWAFLALPATASHLVPFALMIRGLASELTVLTNHAIEVTGDMRATLANAGIALETAPIARLVGGTQLTAIELANGNSVRADVLFAQPPQQQTALVRALGLELDDGYVKVDPMKRETSITGIYASGDLTTRGQAAILASATGMQAAAAINVDLAMEGPH
jgi:thioredoxin reductase